jgi:hypothetical protein
MDEKSRFAIRSIDISSPCVVLPAPVAANAILAEVKPRSAETKCNTDV